MKGISGTVIIAAAERRAVALPSDLAGYLVLGVLDALDGRRGVVTPEDLRLTDEGRIGLVRVQPASREAAELGCRELLRRLVDVAASPSPALLRAAEPSVGLGATVLADELHTALVPVNRGAARRALARLHREIERISGKLPDIASAEAVKAEVDRAQAVYAEPQIQAKRRLAMHDGPGIGVALPLPSAAPVAAALAPKISVEHDSRNVVDLNRVIVGEIPDLLVPEKLSGSLRAGLVEHLAADRDEPEYCQQSLISDGSAVPPDRLAFSSPTIGLDPFVGEAPPLVGVGRAEGLSVRETTLVMAPVASLVTDTFHDGKVSVESGKSSQAAVGGVAAECGLPAASVAQRMYETELDCSMVLPGSIVEHTIRLPEVSRMGSSDSRIREYSRPAFEPAEPTQALPLVTRRRAPVVSAVPAEEKSMPTWDATNIEAVVEVADEEIIYDNSASSGEWFEVDCSDLLEFEVVAPLIRVLAPGEPLLAGRSSWVNDADLQPEDDVHWGSKDGAPPASDPWTESETHYRPATEVQAPPHSSATRLAEVFESAPQWTERELCRNLRLAAGLELTPGAPHAQTRTPPPTTAASPTARSSEQLEPTRRIRRACAMLAVVVGTGTLAYAGRYSNASVASASQLSVDAVGRLCRASVTVSGVESGHILYMRQNGDTRFSGPSSRSVGRAEFIGMRCGVDAELLVGDNEREGVKRWPISGSQLQPQGVHPAVQLELDLRESS